jgi:micrococcal nuclease
LIRFIKTIHLLALFFLIIPTISIAGQYQVVRVVDGDPIVVKYGGKYEKVRMLCVNTPESVHPNEKQNIPMGKVASRYTQKKLIGKFVDLEFELKRLRGNYGRLLAHVFVDGQNLNLDLVRQGLSPYYTKYGKIEKYDVEFRAAEKKARKEKLNIWGDPELTKKNICG